MPAPNILISYNICKDILLKVFTPCGGLTTSPCLNIDRGSENIDELLMLLLPSNQQALTTRFKNPV